MTRFIRRRLAVATVFAAMAVSAASPGVWAAGSTKDIVLDRITAPAASLAAPGGTTASVGNDAMAVSVLLESADGTLTPRGTDKMFRTGDRFRVKVLASRDAKMALYNTNPKGVLGQEPVWRGEVKVGQETISPRLRLDGNSGVDQLHIVLEPAQDSGVFAWLGNWLRSSTGATAKDIRLDTQNTESATYLLSANGKGLVTTMRIVHR